MIWNANNGAAALDGDTMHYVSFGRGEKALVLLPGLSDGLATVKNKALLLAAPYRVFFENYTVYMFSRRDHLPRGCTIRDMARDQAAALDALGIGHASVLGVSQGGMIAQYLAADHPDKVDNLVLAVTAPRCNEIAAGCLHRWIGFAGRGDHRGLMIDTAERSYSEARLRKYRRLYPILGHIGKPKSYDRFLTSAEAILSFDATEDLDRIVCPTLILGGGEDKVVGAQASYELNARIRGSALHVYPGLGHAAYEEAPDFDRRIFAFLED